MNMNFDDQYDPLCCCEYFDRNNERNHILACCCNCFDFDQVFENFLCCRPINKLQKQSMISAIFDRLRVPWRGGAKLISWESLVPFILNAILINVATLNLTCSIVSILVLWYITVKANRDFDIIGSRVPFHYFWSLSTFIYLFLIFELKMPLYEFLPEENIIFVIFCFVTVGLVYRTKDLSTKQKFTNSVTDSSSKEDDTKILISDNDEKIRPRINRAQHNDYYNCWIDAYVDQTNKKYYIAALISTIITFVLYSNLTLTAVCHPYLLITIFNTPISVPDDCTGIYDLYDVAIGFVGGFYAILICLVAFFYIVKYMFINYCRDDLALHHHTSLLKV